MDRRAVAAVFDRLVPADDFPAVSEGGLWELLAELRAEPATAALVDRAEDVVGALGGDVVGLTPQELDERIAALAWEDRDHLVQLAAQAYYGQADRPGARMVGFDRRPKRDPGAPVVEPVLATTAVPAVGGRYDVVVLGAGAGGGVAACVAAEAGASVLLVDRGAVLRSDDVPRDHLRNHRSRIHGENTHVAPREPRDLVAPDGDVVRIRRSHEAGWHDDAMAVGGGTRVYQGIAWRFHPLDFAMASTYGVPDGSSLADWPLTYDDLEPHYTWAEHALGVCGDGAAHREQGARSAPYPMSPLPPGTEARVLAGAAERIGLRAGPVPLLLNSEPRDGRARCVRCGECVGFACPSDARNGSHDTVIPRALATGNATLVERCRATALLTDGSGRVDGVRLFDERTGAAHDVRAGHVVVACGAVESARLLLASRSDRHPDGLGNRHDQVGRHLQGHVFVSAFGLHDDRVLDMAGPGVWIGTLDHLHGNPGVIGGGVIGNEPIKLPIVHWRWSLPPDAPRWGLPGKAAMRDSYLRTSHLFCQVQEVTRAGNRVTLGDDVDDAGMPIVRLHGEVHPETRRAALAVQGAAARWMEASGAGRVWVDDVPAGLTAGTHQAGTCRMGTDPTTSVVGPDGRVHGHENLWVADASVHVTNGGVGPALTVYALAHRTAGFLSAS